MSKLLDQLLRPELPDVMKDLPTKRVEVKRLSALEKEPVVFELHGLPYGRVQELQRLSEDMEIMILLDGCPELKDKSLMEHFGAPTPVDAVKHLLLPGEITDLSRAVERLCGYRQNTIRELKN
jgi:hypothetical protein